MKNSLYVLHSALVIITFSVLLSGCAGLSRQYRASTEGISVNYTVKKEQFADPKAKVFVSSSDDRLDKEVIGDGVELSVGDRVLGFVAFGVISFAMPDQPPTFEAQQDPVRIFKTAMIERLAQNGIIVTSDTESGALSLDLAVRQFKLDFNSGTWIGEVGYVARMKKGGEIICESNVYEKATAFNLYGFGSGEEAISEAFNKAIDKLDVNSCFLKGQK